MTTQSGKAGLFWRWFSPVGVVGSVESSGGGSVNFSSADGMFLSGPPTERSLSATTGALHAVPFNGGSPARQATTW